MIICDRCLQPLDPELAHWDHKDDCPRSHGVEQDEVDCDCDISCHAECCRFPSCTVLMPAHKNARAV